MSARDLPGLRAEWLAAMRDADPSGRLSLRDLEAGRDLFALAALRAWDRMAAAWYGAAS